MTIDNSFPKMTKFYALSLHYREQWTNFSHNTVTDLTYVFDEIILHASTYKFFYIQLKFFVIWAGPCEASTQWSPDTD